MPVIVGTSGWMYDDWRHVLYPAGLPRRLWLERYAECFDTVENNNAFYRLPSVSTFQDYRDRTPPTFVMAVKASRFLTHIKRLKDPAEPVERLLRVADGLGTKLGPILLQLPPTLQADPDRLDGCLRCFPAAVRVAVEPRHVSWWITEVREVLERRGAALCWADRLGRPQAPLWRTTDWAYVRFHEGAAHPRPAYGDRALSAWVRRIEGTWGDDDDVYSFFNNDVGGAAVHDAARFADLARAAGRHVTRTPATAHQGVSSR
ncbi:MAG: hypothetical protein JWN00_427 [Actinomycetia bacterium]|nr:hypothetical protein [Actinomycetes bacterium]